MICLCLCIMMLVQLWIIRGSSNRIFFRNEISSSSAFPVQVFSSQFDSTTIMMAMKMMKFHFIMLLKILSCQHNLTTTMMIDVDHQARERPPVPSCHGVLCRAATTGLTKKNRPKVPIRNLKNHKKPSQTDDNKQDDHKNMIAASQSSIPAAEADWPQSDTQGNFPQFHCKNQNMSIKNAGPSDDRFPPVGTKPDPTCSFTHKVTRFTKRVASITHLSN